MTQEGTVSMYYFHFKFENIETLKDHVAYPSDLANVRETSNDLTLILVLSL